MVAVKMTEPPETENPSDGEGRQGIIRRVDDTETAPDLRTRRLRARFGFAYETAVVISALAFSVAR